MKAEGEDQLEVACQPITVSTKYLVKAATGLTGFTPTWTLQTKKVLDGGCYYFFSTFLFSENLGEGDEAAPQGGVRQGGVRQGGM